MKTIISGFIASAWMLLPLSAGTVIFSDNFNAPDNASLDASSQTGRTGGMLAGAAQVRSSRTQHGITANMLRYLLGSSEPRIRFHDLPGLAWHNFAAGVAGTTTLTEGGLRIEFDWLPLNNTDTNWIAVEVGISTAEPATRVTDAGTDFGILFRNSGGTQYFDNGVAATGGSFTATPNALWRHVVLEYAFTSFADGSSVTANVWVNGTQVVTNKVFDWNGNGGVLNIEAGTNSSGSLLDNLVISTLSSPADSDGDGISDAWETAKAGNLTDLSNAAGPGPGAGTGDFDGDGLTDVQEYNLSRATSNLGIDPKSADTDGDGLSDFQEMNPTAPRTATSPTLADTDVDGLNDAAETNTGAYTDASNTGSNGQLVDTDGDNFPDGYEVQRGGNPVAAATLPANLPSGVTMGTLTDEASTGISASETYTVKLSGGLGATINGVTMDLLNTTATPAGIVWDAGVGGKAAITTATNSSWVPATGNVTGAGNLTMLGTFAYSGNGTTPNCSQRYTLLNLEPGRRYDLRLYIRMWSTTTVRPEAVKFTNGPSTTDVFVLLDRPGTMLGNANDHSAYFLQFSYMAQAATATLELKVPRIATANGSYHLYGLANRVGTLVDDDADGISDYWETLKTGNLSTLGPAPSDADNDGLTDVAEWGLVGTYPSIDPTKSDTDGDGLTDGAEVAGAGSRPPTSPVSIDTDGDTISDTAETNTGNYVSGTDTGTNPALKDTDGDSFPDNYEISVISNPNNIAVRPPLPAGVTLGLLTDDASTGISASETYTHKISGGYGVTINGVPLDALTDLLTPANFTWNTGSFTKSIISPANLNDWQPATGGITGTGVQDLLSGFTYSGSGANPGGAQQFTLSGLTPGQAYELKLFIRPWGQTGSGRPVALKFTNGTEIADIWPGFGVYEDKSGNVTANYSNTHAAYALTFSYTAQGSSLIIDANVPSDAPANSGSFHLYGLTNRAAGPAKPLNFVSVLRNPNGSSITLTIDSRPGRVYAVDLSQNLSAWIELTDNLPSTGQQTIFVDSIGSNFQRTFYRVRDVTSP